MKIALFLLTVLSMASATSIRQYDQWECKFPNPIQPALIKSTNVTIVYDFVLNRGTVTVFQECPTCHSLLKEIKVARDSRNGVVSFKSAFSDGINLQIFSSKTSAFQTPQRALLGKLDGTCLQRY